ncbi:MAG: DUF1579 domain-containing protein [Bacteroidetes bacterium]|nr:DUF1579 domain-containing protein [Bacteroidota bacterium]
MKSTFYALLLTAASFCYVPATSQTNEEMQAAMAYMTPGTIHQMMAKSAGKWVGKVSMWMAPDGQPTTSDVQTEQEMILGGRYLRSHNTGNMMGMPFEGIGVTAYDNAKKIFINTWIDNMGTGIITLQGPWNDRTKSIEFTGTMVDPTNGKDTPIRQVVKFVNDNNQVIEMYAVMNGKEFKTMELNLTRK